MDHNTLTLRERKFYRFDVGWHLLYSWFMLSVNVIIRAMPPPGGLTRKSRTKWSEQPLKPSDAICRHLKTKSHWKALSCDWFMTKEWTKQWTPREENSQWKLKKSTDHFSVNHVAFPAQSRAASWEQVLAPGHLQLLLDGGHPRGADDLQRYKLLHLFFNYAKP